MTQTREASYKTLSPHGMSFRVPLRSVLDGISRYIALMLRNSVSRLYPPFLHLRPFSSRSVSFQLTPNTTLIVFTDTPKLRHHVSQSIRLGWYKSRDPNKCQGHPLDSLVHDRDISMATTSPARPEHEPITTAGCQ